jgi:hypothetical protein
MAGGPTLCDPCVRMLRELCRIGDDPRLCEAEAGYLATGDQRYVEQASLVAPGSLLLQAKQNLKARGVLPQGA